MHNLLDSHRIKDAVQSFSRLYSGVSARPSYLGEVDNGGNTSLLPSVVVMRPTLTNERMAMLTLCLPLSDVAILYDIRRPCKGLGRTGLFSSIADMTKGICFTLGVAVASSQRERERERDSVCVLVQNIERLQ